MLSGDPATAASDVFSFGYVLWELMSWQLPWAGVQPFVVRLRAGGKVPARPPCSHVGVRAAMASSIGRQPAAASGMVPPPTPACPPRPAQVMKLVRQGERPEMPAEERLPGPRPASFEGMGEYRQLIRWRPAACLALLWFGLVWFGLLWFGLV